jgi:hypothetical protein
LNIEQGKLCSKARHMVIVHAVMKNPSKLGHVGPIINDLLKPYYLKSKIIQDITMYALLLYKMC